MNLDALSTDTPMLTLLGSARVSLAPGNKPTKKGLRDTLSGESYQMNPVGRFIVSEVSTEKRIDELTRLVISQFGVDERTARWDLIEFLSFLDHHRLTSIRQSFVRETRSRLGSFLVKWVLIATMRRPPERARYPTRRYIATPANIALRCLEAHQPTLLLGYLSAALAVAAYAVRDAHLGLPPISILSLTTATILLCYFGGIVASVLIHEYAHYIVARALGITSHFVYIRMFVVGLSQQGGTDWSRALVSLAGPAAAVIVLVSLTAGLFFSQLGATGVRFALCLALLMTAAQHIASLAPWSADGKQLSTALGRWIFNATRHGGW